MATAGHVDVPSPPSSIRGMVWGPPPVFVVVWGQRGPLVGAHARGRPYGPRVERSGFAPKGSGEIEPVPHRVGQGGDFP
jgi:hypothetical protein